MPINQSGLKADLFLAETFLASQAGVLLHELGHYVAANAERVVPGHIILTAHSGAFRPLNGLETFDSDHLAFVCAAGALAEHHFCGTILHRRLGPDLAQYVAIRPPADPETRVIDMIEEWKAAYSARMVGLADCIEVNFGRCAGYVDRRRFLMGEHHVIPSAVLKLPYRRTWTGWLGERRATMGSACRRRLGELCNGDSMLRSTSDPR
ncbi:MAG: hypothetical protein KIT48_01410 [Pseudolabrys sp.]|nr:hypothetical protein [Pseudolabrys sp.]